MQSNTSSNEVKSILVLCATKGRKTLPYLIRSFVQQELVPDDRLVILGDGWHEPWIDEHLTDQVLFEKRPKKGYWGHPQLHDYLSEHRSSCDYITLIGDDDIWIPNAFSRIRHLLSDVPVVFNKSKGDAIARNPPPLSPPWSTYDFQWRPAFLPNHHRRWETFDGPKGEWTSDHLFFYREICHYPRLEWAGNVPLIFWGINLRGVYAEWFSDWTGPPQEGWENWR